MTEILEGDQNQPKAVVKITGLNSCLKLTVKQLDKLMALKNFT